MPLPHCEEKMTTWVDALLSSLLSYQKSEEERERLNHGNNEMALTGQTGTQGGPTVVAVVVVGQRGQLQWRGVSNNNNYADDNGDNNGKGGSTAGLRGTAPTEMSMTAKLTKTTTTVVGRNVHVIRGGGGKGCTCHCP